MLNVLSLVKVSNLVIRRGGVSRQTHFDNFNVSTKID